MKYTKQKLWLLLIKELSHFVHNIHVFNVLSILIDEMKKDLVNGKEIRITNFGVIKLEKVQPRLYKNVVSKTMELSEARNKLKFKLSRKLAKLASKIIEERISNE